MTMFRDSSAKHSSRWLHKAPAPVGGSDRDKGHGGGSNAEVRMESDGAFACPECGAVLTDLTLESCSYCGSAFSQTSGDNWKRLWYTADAGVSWTIIVRQCPGCGSQVTDPAASECGKCGHQPLPSLDQVSDPRPTVAIKINFPPESGRARFA
jgi:hypothetical protein